MSGWFTTGTFWVGAIWGASAMAVCLWYWLIRPMGQQLGFEDVLDALDEADEKRDAVERGAA